MDYKKWQRNIPVCLECGDKIRYGRTDKKFCCDECRNRHYNSKLKEGRAYRRKVLAILQKNYDLLDELLKSGVDSADFADLVTLGLDENALPYELSLIFICFLVIFRLCRSDIFATQKRY